MPPLKGPMLASSSPATLQSYLVLPPLSSPSLPLLPPPLPLHSGGPSIWFFDMPPLKYRGLLARCFLPSPRSDMLQSPRTGSEVTSLNPSNHLCFRTCSHYSPSLLSGLREGPISPPVLPKSWQVLAFRQLVKYKRAALLGGGAQHSPGRPPRQRRHTSSAAPGREARRTPSAANN